MRFAHIESLSPNWYGSERRRSTDLNGWVSLTRMPLSMATTIVLLFSLPVVTPGASAQSSGELRTRVGEAPQHYIFFGLDRHRIRDSSFLSTQSIAGAQLKYTWKELEPERGRYRFESLRDDAYFLERHGKRLFVQIQDISFDEQIVNVPDYLVEGAAYGGGVARQYEFEGDDEESATPGGWVARRWDSAVRDRFIRLLQALGEDFDGLIEGVNLAETAIDFGESSELYPEGFTPGDYLEGVIAIMTGLRDAFSRSTVIQYANFMPGEWLPWDDHGYLRTVYAHADSIGMGVGGPDLLPHRRGQQNHSHPLIAGRALHVVAGVAIQDGNFEINPATGKQVTAAELLRFAEATLKLNYIFWGTQEPFYSRDVLPLLTSLTQSADR